MGQWQNELQRNFASYNKSVRNKNNGSYCTFKAHGLLKQVIKFSLAPNTVIKSFPKKKYVYIIALRNTSPVSRRYFPMWKLLIPLGGAGMGTTQNKEG